MQRARGYSTTSVNDNAHCRRTEFIVVFVDKTECRCLRWLKRGFRHCFVALRSEDRWLICDSLKNRIEFSIVDLPDDFDLGDFYYEEGHTVIVGNQPKEKPETFILPEVLTCVAVVKRVIGLQSYWTLTPWRLFCVLNSMDNDWHVLEESKRERRSRHLALMPRLD